VALAAIEAAYNPLPQQQRGSSGASQGGGGGSYPRGEVTASAAAASGSGVEKSAHALGERAVREHRIGQRFAGSAELGHLHGVVAERAHRDRAARYEASIRKSGQKFGEPEREAPATSTAAAAAGRGTRTGRPTHVVRSSSEAELDGAGNTRSAGRCGPGPARAMTSPSQRHACREVAGMLESLQARLVLSPHGLPLELTKIQGCVYQLGKTAKVELAVHRDRLVVRVPGGGVQDAVEYCHAAKER